MKFNNQKFNIMTNINKINNDEISPDDKIYQLETCANNTRDFFKTYGQAWKHCSKKEEFQMVETVTHGANPNLGPANRWDIQELLEYPNSDKKEKRPSIYEGISFKINNLIEEFFNSSKTPDINDYRTGVYAAAYLDPQGVNKIWKYLGKLGLPMQHQKNAHVTIMYSKTRPQSIPKMDFNQGDVTPIGFGIYGKGSSSDPYVLVLKLQSPSLVKSHQGLRKQGLVPTYRDYSPHLTLVLDINRLFPGLKKLTPKQKDNITNVFDKMIPELPRSIKIQKVEISPR